MYQHWMSLSLIDTMKRARPGSCKSFLKHPSGLLSSKVKCRNYICNVRRYIVEYGWGRSLPSDYYQIIWKGCSKCTCSTVAITLSTFLDRMWWFGLRVWNTAFPKLGHMTRSWCLSISRHDVEKSRNWGVIRIKPKRIVAVVEIGQYLKTGNFKCYQYMRSRY